ncbi:MAG: hypothetical protein ACR2NM_13350 [Bythopirellula sp.]
MKPDSPFSKLPSLSELLNHPTVLGVVHRVNQTTIAQRATGFWEELQANLKQQGGMPSVGELAERLAHRLLGRAHHSTPMVNATGVLCSRLWQAPLAESAVHELLRFASDYQQPSSALMHQVATSLAKLTGAEAAWVACSYEAAVSMASQCEGATIVSSPLIGLIDPAEFGYEHVDTIAERVNSGGDLVIFDGSGLLGGPRCGIVVGSKPCVAKLQSSELSTALAAEAMVLAALEATLDLYLDLDKVIHQIPVLQLLSAPLDNLQQRCERIAPLLAECDLVAHAEATSLESIWLDAGISQCSHQSWSIVLQPEEGQLERLGKRFEQATPQVVSSIGPTTCVLDFRAIFPRWDQQLVLALEATK